MSQLQQRLSILFLKFAEISEPIVLGSHHVIIHQGLKLSKIKTSNGPKILLEDTSFDTYSPIENSILIESLIDYANRQKSTCRARKNSKCLD